MIRMRRTLTYSQTRYSTILQRNRTSHRQFSSSSSSQCKLVRLSKRMSELDLCSRREADQFIARGQVLLRGTPISPILGQKVSSEELDIRIKDDQNENDQNEKEWWERVRGTTVVFHKPKGYVSGQPHPQYHQIPSVAFLTRENLYHHPPPDPNHSHPSHHPQELEYLNFESINHRIYHHHHHHHPIHKQHHRKKQHHHRLNLTSPTPTLSGYAPAGRLDKDSSGILLFTQHGIVAKKLISPTTNIDKEYIVTVSSSSTIFPDLEPLYRPDNYLQLDHRPLLPVVKAEWINDNHHHHHNHHDNHPPLRRMSQRHRSHPPNSHSNTHSNTYHHLQLRIILREGRKRQIRRMCDELLHLKVLSLHRIRIGPVSIGTLPEGTWRPLVPTEVQSILGT